MNKRNKILVGCLALLLVLSVGYALYSETITINGTATAKVNFDIETTCEVTTSNTADPKGIYTIGGTGNCEIEDGIIKTTSTLNKPGDMVVYKVNIKNAGTIPALLETVVSPNNSYDDGTSGGDVTYYDSTKSLMAAFGIGGELASVSQM